MLRQMIKASGPDGPEVLVNRGPKNDKHEEKSKQLGGTCVCAVVLSRCQSMTRGVERGELGSLLCEPSEWSIEASECQ